MKKTSLLLTLICLTGFAFAQNNFLIYSYKGNVSVVENNVETKAKVGKTMNTAATLKIAAGSVATLICNEEAMFTISKPGTYAMNKMGDSCKVNHSSFTANYIRYVWN